MTIQMQSSAFRRAINLATLAVERHNRIPILGAIRCHANGSFSATGTDLDLAVTADVARAPGPDVDFVLKTPRNVVAALAAAGDDSVELAVESGSASMTSGVLAMTASTYPAGDFPSELLRPLDVNLSGTLSRENIAQMMRVFGAVSTEETRYYLNGICVEKAGNTSIRAAATDGHRLYYADLEVPDLAGALNGPIIVPRKLLGILFGLSKGATDGIRLEVGPQAPANRPDSTAPERTGVPRFAVSMKMRDASVRLCGKLIDGTFPDYRRVIPTEPGKQALFKVADLRRAVVAISGHSKDTRAAKFTFEAGKCIVTAAFVDIGLSASVAVPCAHKLGKYEIGYNGRHLAGLLDAVAGDEIVFEFGEPSSPASVRNPADPSWGAVIMPMRV